MNASFERVKCTILLNFPLNVYFTIILLDENTFWHCNTQDAVIHHHFMRTLEHASWNNTAKGTDTLLFVFVLLSVAVH